MQIKIYTNEERTECMVRNGCHVTVRTAKGVKCPVLEGTYEIKHQRDLAQIDGEIQYALGLFVQTLDDVCESPPPGARCFVCGEQIEAHTKHSEIVLCAGMLELGVIAFAHNIEDIWAYADAAEQSAD